MTNFIQCPSNKSGVAADRGPAAQARFIYQIIPILAYCILFAASVLKAHELITKPTIGSGLLANRWILLAALEVELLIGYWLVSNWHPRFSHGIAALCFLGFAIVSGFEAFSGKASCGCFGRVLINPWYTFVLDVLLAIGLGICALHASAPVTSRKKRKHMLFAIPVVVVGVIAAYKTIGQSPEKLGADGFIQKDAELIVIEPDTWTGKRCPLLPYIDVRSQISKGNWTILLYHHDCHICQQAISQYQLRAVEREKTDTEHLALIEMPPYGEMARNNVNGIAAFGQLDKSHEWFATTPVVLHMVDGQVLSSKEGEAALLKQEVR